MQSLSELVYCPLKDEEVDTTGWSKDTIVYATQHKSKVYSTIRGIGKSLGKILPRADVEDIYEILIDYLYRSDDYNISKAYSENNFVTFDGYMHSCIKYCVIRFVTKSFKEEKTKVSENITDEDGKELSIFDAIPDKKKLDIIDFNNVGLDYVCKSLESDRYTYGIDLFMIWFIRLQTIVCNKNDRYEDILSVLGISKKELNDMEKNTKVNGVMLNIARAVSKIGPIEALKILKEYTYSYKKIEEVIDLF